MIKKVKNLIAKNIINVYGFKTHRKLIVIESDDWGSIRIPSKQIRETLVAQKLIAIQDPFSRYDGLENEEDLNLLFALLLKFKDKNGNPPVITANCLMGNPDFKKIKASNFQNYFHESVKKTFESHQGHERCFSLWEEGNRLNVFHPQYHGREHLNVDLWMNKLQQKEEVYLKAFDYNTFAVSPDGVYPQGNNIMAAFDYTTAEEEQHKITVFEEGNALFTEFFGYQSKSFIAPCYVWNERLETLIQSLGVNFFQGSKFQNIPDIKVKKFKKKYHFTGQKNDNGQYYLVRNCLFEPSLNSDVDWVSACMKSISNSFFWKRPAIIGSHRINFVSLIEKSNRDTSLFLLEELLKKILQKWPDVEFVTSDELGGIITSAAKE